MRRAVIVLLLWCLAVVPAGVAAAQGAPESVAEPSAPLVEAPLEVPADLPPGFTDGEPVGGDPELEPVPPAGSAGDPVAGTSAAEVPGSPTVARATTETVRYFGDGPWRAIEDAARTTPRDCTLSDAGLTALVVSPVFKESSAATTASSAPSPMTLSRWDEWSGTYGTSRSYDLNYGLYAFRQPYTAYPQAYWHPGIGIWQYDSAGVGAPYTAIERMDVSVVARDVASGMARRYCNPTTASAGHAGPYTAQDRRNAAWAPWRGTSASCTLCQAEFDRLTATTPWFANVRMVEGISTTGGAARRSCTLGGSAVECWYVDPSVGVIQGATAWATLAPDGRGSPTVAPAPLSKPFYVVKRAGYEERHWLRADTGYGTDISARRQLGKDARPRASQAGSGLAWTASSGLCDVTAGRGACPPPPPPPPPPTGAATVPGGMTATDLKIAGTYRTLALDADGDGREDVLWYAPGAAADSLWLGQGSGRFRSLPLAIVGDYDRVLTFDPDGDGDEDVLWYATATGASSLWRSRGDGTFAPTTLRPGAGRVPLALDTDADGRDELFWYGPGARPDAWWRWTGAGFAATTAGVAGTYTPLVGDFDGNGREDILWYAPGEAGDSLWLSRAAGGVRKVGFQVRGTYQPLVGDFDGDARSDVVWYAPGSTADSVWFGAPDGAFQTAPLTVNGRYRPVVADLGGDGRDDVLWYAPGTGTDTWFTWEPVRARGSRHLDLDGHQQPIVGAFSSQGRDGILWYAPGSGADVVWWR